MTNILILSFNKFHEERESETDRMFSKHGFIVFGIKSSWRTSVQRSLSGHSAVFIYLVAAAAAFLAMVLAPFLLCFLAKRMFLRNLGSTCNRKQALKHWTTRADWSWGNPHDNHELTARGVTLISVAPEPLRPRPTGAEHHRKWSSIHSQINTAAVLGLIWFSFDCDSVLDTHQVHVSQV